MERGVEHAKPLQGDAGGVAVVAGVQVHGGPGGPWAERVEGGKGLVQGGASSGESWRLAGAGTAVSGMSPASVASERFRPCLPRSTGLRPASWPPQGALVMHPSTARVSDREPEHAVVGRKDEQV
jgi:hypothetical protein